MCAGFGELQLLPTPFAVDSVVSGIIGLAQRAISTVKSLLPPLLARLSDPPPQHRHAGGRVRVLLRQPVPRV